MDKIYFRKVCLMCLKIVLLMSFLFVAGFSLVRSVVALLK